MSVSLEDITFVYDQQEKAYYAQNPATGEFERCTIIPDGAPIDLTRGPVFSLPDEPPTHEPSTRYQEPSATSLAPLTPTTMMDKYMSRGNEKLIDTSAHICEAIYPPRRLSGKTIGVGVLVLAVLVILLIPTFGHASTTSAIHIQLKKMPQTPVSLKKQKTSVIPTGPSSSLEQITPLPLRIVPPGDSSVVGNPTISASFIDQVLAAYHSPAAGLGQEIYDDGVAVNIDPGFALAFFMHESSFGKAGEAVSSLNPGNLRCIPGVACRDNFAWFPSWHAGFQAWYHLIRFGYVNGAVSRLCPCVTVGQIIPVYAPPADNNNDNAYIAAVLKAMQTWRTGQIYVS